MMFVIAGFTLILTGGEAYRYNAPNFVWMGNGVILGLPVPFVVFIICALIGEGVLRFTPFGRYVYATGSNTTAANLAGVPVQRLMWRCSRSLGCSPELRPSCWAPGFTQPVRVWSLASSCG